MTNPTERVLDWRPRFDPRSRDYPIRATIERREAIPQRRQWRHGLILDQGREGACVGFGWTAEALATPVRVPHHRLASGHPDRFARDVYAEAKTRDPWPGEAYEGTSVLAGAQTMTARGLIREYRWAFGIQDAVDAILTVGPVVLGIEWRQGMYEAPGGVLKSTGAVVGGHCLLAIGRHPQVEALGGVPGVLLQNSWGTSWGVDGLAWIAEAELGRLLAAGGEACVPTRRSYGRAR
jgi:hypothetical protein